MYVLESNCWREDQLKFIRPTTTGSGVRGSEEGSNGAGRGHIVGKMMGGSKGTSVGGRCWGQV